MKRPRSPLNVGVKRKMPSYYVDGGPVDVDEVLPSLKFYTNDGFIIWDEALVSVDEVVASVELYYRLKEENNDE